MYKTRNRLLVTLVLTTVAMAVVATAAFARPNTLAVRYTPETSIRQDVKPAAVVLNGDPDTPANTGPTPNDGVIQVVLQPGNGETGHARFVPTSALWMWAGWIWAAQLGAGF